MTMAEKEAGYGLHDANLALRNAKRHRLSEDAFLAIGAVWCIASEMKELPRDPAPERVRSVVDHISAVIAELSELEGMVEVLYPKKESDND